MIHTGLTLGLGLVSLSFMPQTAVQSGGRTVAPLAGGAQIAGGVPKDHMILGETEDPPPGYSFAGLYPLVRTGENPSWSAGPPMPTGETGGAVVQVGTDIYVLGGFNGSYLNTVRMLDTTTGIWYPKPPMPTSRSSLTAAVVGHKIFAIGGEVATNVPTGVVEAYDLDLHAWDPPTYTSLNTPRAHLASGVMNGRIYAIGGIINATVQAANEEYDPLLNTWTPKAPMLTPRSHLAAAVLNGRIYTIGGWSVPVYVATNDLYDPATNTWESKASMSNLRGSLGVVAANARIYAMGGQASGAIMWLDTVEEYDPLYDYWYTIQSMPTPRSGLGAAALPTGEVYAIGGTYAGFSPAVEVYESGFRMLFAHRKN